MSHSIIWELFGDTIASRHKQTLAAYLGDPDAGRALENDAIAVPTIDDFRADSVFDPNPHHLKLEKDHVETSLFVKSLAVWGPAVLIRAAFVCAQLQIEKQVTCRADLVVPRDAAFHAVKALIGSSTDENRQAVRQAAEDCGKLYTVLEDDPDSPEAQTVWSQLGAAWFAAETAAQDFKLEDYDGPGPREASSTWCRRNAVWPVCAAEAAAEWSTHDNVGASIRSAILDWILNS